TERLGGEEACGGAEALKAAIARDVAQARRVLGGGAGPVRGEGPAGGPALPLGRRWAARLDHRARAAPSKVAAAPPPAPRRGSGRTRAWPGASRASVRRLRGARVVAASSPPFPLPRWGPRAG